jgi:hypothetical protein
MTAPRDPLAEALDDAIHALSGGDLAGGLVAVHVARERLAPELDAAREDGYGSGLLDGEGSLREHFDLVPKAALAPRPTADTVDPALLDTMRDIFQDLGRARADAERLMAVAANRGILIEFASAIRDATSGLDVAWAEVEAAIPDGWVFHALTRRPNVALELNAQGETKRWRAVAWVPGANYSPSASGSGPTPAAALTDLASALRAAESPTPEPDA